LEGRVTKETRRCRKKKGETVSKKRAINHALQQPNIAEGGVYKLVVPELTLCWASGKNVEPSRMDGNRTFERRGEGLFAFPGALMNQEDCSKAEKSHRGGIPASGKRSQTMRGKRHL